ncbi:putative ETC complex I subunit conserved region [Trypoxylus dichotomus]
MANIFGQKLYPSFLRCNSKFHVRKALKSESKNITVQVDCSRLRTCRRTSRKGLARPIPLKEATATAEELEYENKWRHQPVDTPKDELLTETNFIPKELQLTRTARIYKEAKNAMQSGNYSSRFWKIMFDVHRRWENPLMGWTSSGDALSNVKLNFFTMADAIRHCEKNGWDYYVDRPMNVTPLKTRSYSSNFAWNRRFRTSTK